MLEEPFKRKLEGRYVLNTRFSQTEEPVANWVLLRQFDSSAYANTKIIQDRVTHDEKICDSP